MGKTKFENGESLKAKAIKKNGDKVIINVRMAMIKDNITVNGIIAVMEKA